MAVQDALTAAVAGVAQCEVPESLVHQMGEGECVPMPMQLVLRILAAVDRVSTLRSA